MMIKKRIIFFLAILFANTLFAQNDKAKLANSQEPFVLGVIDKIQSAELNETRTVNIYLPEGYSPDSAIIYPVIYLLDGSVNEDFIHVVGIVQFLTMIEVMPKSIVVGIANVDRRRDLTFPTTIAQDKKDYPTTGSSAKFMKFIEKELQPFIQKKYKVNNSKTIIGQSLGGLFATEVLLKNPGLFDNYIIVSPSLWWDNESLLTAAPKLWKKQTGKKNKIYISVGSEGKQMEDDARNLSKILETPGGNNLQISFVSLPAENHLTILHNSVYKAFQILYAKKPMLKE
ncbi:MAG: alpha/beta hydrolase-fold protein [Ferruginibacter sp.]